MFTSRIDTVTKYRRNMCRNQRQYLMGFSVGLIICGLLSGCGIVETEPEESQLLPSVPMNEIAVPEGFDFRLRTEHTMVIKVEAPGNAAYPGVRVTLGRTNGNEITSGVTGVDGKVKLNFITSISDSEITVSAPAIGIVAIEHQFHLNGTDHFLVIR